MSRIAVDLLGRLTLGADSGRGRIGHYSLSAPTAGAEYAELVALWISKHHP
jgi:hypothetical protein